MTTDNLLRKCHELAGMGPETALDPDSLVGFFQTFRPDGSGLSDLFNDLEVGEELQSRLATLCHRRRRPSTKWRARCLLPRTATQTD